MSCSCGAAPRACSRALARGLDRTNRRSARVSARSHDPAEVLGELNCHPISTTAQPEARSPVVEAIWNAEREAADAPFANSDLAISIAAYEHELDAAPSPSRAQRPKPSGDAAGRARADHA